VTLLPIPRRVDLTGTVGAAPTVEPRVHVGAAGIAPQGYELTITADQITIDAADQAGAFYARATLDQLRHQHLDLLPAGRITDWPDVAVRGVMLDISRDKVPTMATLFDLVDRLARWKVNHVQLYIEHTFAYYGHEEVWRDASPFTPDEIRELDAFCAARHVELVANRNCLGHMERWFAHDRYRPLALFPNGSEPTRPWLTGEPTTLDPTSADALDFVADLLRQHLACHTSRRVHVGLDEPWELPDDRLDDYAAWMRKLADLPELDGREMLVWGDILSDHPELIAGVPDTATVVEWGYESWWPFDDRVSRLADAGVEFWIAPGTSSWLSLLGRTPNMIGNQIAAAESAARFDATGILNTDWGDRGHLQYLPVSEPGFALGAAVSWCLDANRDLDLGAALNVHAFDDSAGELGPALLALGSAYEALTLQVPNIASFVLPLVYPQLADRALDPTTDVEFEALRSLLADGLGHAERSQSERGDAALILDEVRNAVALADVLAHGSRTPDRLEHIRAEHRRLWLARNRPGGLDDSTRWLDAL